MSIACWPVSAEQRNLLTMLRVRREFLGLTQETLAGQLGTSQPNISAWERGDYSPTLGILIRWTRALDCKLELCGR